MLVLLIFQGQPGVHATLVLGQRGGFVGDRAKAFLFVGDPQPPADNSFFLNPRRPANKRFVTVILKTIAIDRLIIYLDAFQQVFPLYVDAARPVAVQLIEGPYQAARQGFTVTGIGIAKIQLYPRGSRG